jgi:CheY-like chemotaxis protein
MAAIMSTPPVVLVVDDDAGVRRVMGLILREAGYAVTLATDGHDALRCVAEASVVPDLVITDLNMTGMSGVGLLIALRARGLHVPTVFMSAGTNPRAAAVAYGADGYIPKPFDIDRLIATVAGLLARNEERPRRVEKTGMAESLNASTLAVVNSNDDLLRILGDVGQEAGFAVVTVHADEVGRSAEAIQAFLQRHNPKVVVYDISPPYPGNWGLFCSVRDAEQLAETGRQFVVTTPNKAALERLVGPTAAIELVGAQTDRDLIAETIRRAATV